MSGLVVRRRGALVAASLVALAVPAHAAAADPPGTKRVTITRFGSAHERPALDPVEIGGVTVAAQRVIVRFTAGTPAAEQAEAHRAAQATEVQALRLPRAVAVHVRAGAEQRALAVYRGRPDVAYAELDRVVRATETPDDPLFSSQWGMTQIRLPQAWDVTHATTAVRVAILDCGIYHAGASTVGPGHSDINGKVVLDANFTTAPDADDWCDHGTHVAGIAAAQTNNAVGVAGGGWNARLMNGKVLDDTGSGLTSWVANGIVWAASNGAHVINVSAGADGACPSVIQDAVNYAWAQGVVIVVSAGNENVSPGSNLALCSNTLSVAATTSLDTKAAFSNWGSAVDVAAPGEGILSTEFEGSYAFFDGTSMASPLVAGLAALVWTSGPTTNAAVVNRITSTAAAIAGTGLYWTHGRVDAAAAVATPPTTPSLNWAAQHSTDFDGDRVTDFGLYRGLSPADSLWYAPGTAAATPFQIYFAATGDIPVPGDYDGDGKTDAVIYRPSSGLWYGPQTGAAAIVIQTIVGGPGKIPVPGDYDGDGKTDPAYWDPATGLFFGVKSSGGVLNIAFGQSGDVPVPRDYDGDGKTDPAIYRSDATPEHYGLWYAVLSAGGVHQIYFGAPGDVPVPGDYDGDKKADSVIYRPTTGLWYGPRTGAAEIVIQTILGDSGDVPIPGYYDSDLSTDIAIFRPATGLWFAALRAGGTRSISGLGLSTDVPVQKRPSLAGGV